MSFIHHWIQIHQLSKTSRSNKRDNKKAYLALATTPAVIHPHRLCMSMPYPVYVVQLQ